MKTHLNHSGASRSRLQQPGGAALVLVLAFLVLITALVIAFFSSVTTEFSGSKQYAGGATAKQLADSAVQTVMGTIKLATSGTTAAGNPLAWASQPGMIRTYDTGGLQVACYKLYSSDAMVVTPTTGTSGFDPSTDLDSSWATKPALYTDLNAPIVYGATAVFPIIDGNGVKTLSKTSASGAAVTSYYGYDTTGTGSPNVEGFGVTIDPANKLPSYNSATALSPTNTPVPMPTKWIYVLQDGTLTAPDATSTGTATFANAPANKMPSLTNPITGRIAFWTDDETCKVNINTASEGTFWDIPRVSGSTTSGPSDQAFATYQPVEHEFQRYPGHPSMTSLSPVFASLWSGTDPVQNEQIYAIAPRVVGGGSKGGTVKTAGITTLGQSLTPDSDRLYASIDELMFKPVLVSGTRSAQGISQSQLEQSRFFITATSRAPDVNLFNKPRVCIWPISSSSGTTYRTTFDNTFAFCSTSGTGNIYYFQRANSDDPTVDLMQTTPGTVATYSGRNRMLLDYLRNLTLQQIPGFGGQFNGTTGKYKTSNAGGLGTDCDQILTEIFDYIRCTNLNDKGVASGFAPGVNSGGWNTMGTGQVVPIQDGARGTRGFGRFPTVDKAFFMFIGNAQNPPYSGTFTTTSGATLTSPSTTFIIPTVAEMNPYDAGSNKTGVLNGRMRMQAGFFLNPYCPAFGHINILPRYKITVTGLDKFSWGPIVSSSTVTMQVPQTVSGTTTNITATVVSSTATLGMPATATFSTPEQYPTPQWPIAKCNVMQGGNMGFMSLVLGQGLTGAGSYPCVAPTVATTSTTSGTTTITTTDPEATGINSSGAEVLSHFWFSGGTATVKIYNAGAVIGGSSALVQTLSLYFPPSPLQGFPLPKLAPTIPTEGLKDNTGYDHLGNFRSFVAGVTTIHAGQTANGVADSQVGQSGTGGRLSSAGDGPGGFQPCAWIIDTDVVRSIEATSGDVRLVAAQAVVSNTSMYTPHVNYASTTSRMAHSLRGVWNNPYYGATYGRLVNLSLCSIPFSAGSYSTCSSIAGTPAAPYQWTYTNNGQYWDPGTPSQTGTGVYVGGASDPRQIPGDWDNASGPYPDGPYINKADEGESGLYYSGTTPATYTPYYEIWLGETPAPKGTLFSPNRQIPSAGIFGSLSTGVFANSPWQTLLFRSLPVGHPGLGTSLATGSDVGPPYSASAPPDHLFLDLFNMPVVEPYPISEPLSTAGRINMNYQIAPFTYINRDTGIRAVLKSERMVSIADAQSATYKGGSTYSVLYPVNIDETLTGFKTRFNTNHDLFRSPSEICSIHMVPLDTSATGTNANYANMAAYWAKHQPTGDNTRERIYATVYPRLTTKSNTFTVHFRVQTLQKAKSTSATIWDGKNDSVVSEYRGSQTIERYIDANDPNIPDYANYTAAAANTPIDVYYKFRVLGSKKFTP